MKLKIPNVFVKPLKATKKFSKELLIAFILAIVAAVILEVYIGNVKRKRMENNAKAVATLLVYNSKSEQVATASGVFISSDGRLVTNCHVLEKANKIEAKLPTGAIYRWEGTLGISKKHDLAILKFDAREVPYIKVETKKESEIRIGDAIYTIGSPMGLGESVSEGVISNPSRKLGDLEFIQFTAAISSGNSGGGLFSKDGVMLGVTSSTIAAEDKSQNVQNLNFAVPSKYIEKALNGQDIEFTESSPDYYYSQGVIYFDKKEYEKAEQCLKTAIGKDGRYAGAYEKLGDLYYELQRYEDEIRVLEQAATLVPNDAEVYYSLAAAYEDVSKYDLALEAYENVIRLNPNHKDALYMASLLLIIAGRKDLISDHLKKLKQLDPGIARELEVLVSRTR